MTDSAAGAGALRPPRWQQVIPRQAVLAAGVVVLIAVISPPVDAEAQRHLFVETLQFALLAYVVPPLLVLGCPGRLRERLAGNVIGSTGRPTSRMGRRRGGPVRARSWIMVVIFALVAILWRIPPAVDAVGRHPALVLCEAASLGLVGIGLWLELTDSSLAVAAVPGPKKIVIAGIAMWSIWIAAYSLGFSRHVWYPAFARGGTSTVTLINNQEISAAVLFAFAFIVFVPVVFSWLIRWLHDEEGPEPHLHALVSRPER